MFELFGMGKAWAGAFKSDPLGERRSSLIPNSPISAPTLKFNDSAPGKSATDAARTKLGDATKALRDAFGAYSRETKPVYTTTWSNGGPGAASLGGLSARIDPINVDYSSVHSRLQVNSQTAELSRSSTSGIGLDVTSPEAASRLTSSAGLGLDLAGASSVKVSKEEMNTGITTSYGSGSLTFSGSGGNSASIGTLSGTYKGGGKAGDATALTVTVTKGGEIKSSLLGLGQTRIELEVRDQTGEVIKTYSGDLESGEQVDLGADIDLKLSFGSGMLTTGHTSTFAVAKTPTTVDANARFDAAAGVRPQFEAVAAVTAGSFQINGTTIDVYANDTINTVLDRITNSAAGVTATVADDKVTLTTKDYSDADITINGDTSQFIKAVRLDGAATVKGDLSDEQRLLKDTTTFRNIIDNGSFTLNGQTIQVRRNTDTLETLLNRINASGAGVTASFNKTTNRIEIATNSASEDLITIGNDTSGFVGTALLVTNNTVRGNVRDDRQVFAKTTQFASVVSGSFSVNGVTIAVNKDTDSLSSIIGKVNGSGAGVTASYDAANDKLVFTPTTGSLALSDDTSGFLAAAKVATGTTLTTDHVNPDAAFNATGLNRPFFDPGTTVTAGTFTINGVAINVAANDSINSVLAKITGSAAGVTASYDSTTELVTLTSNVGNNPITIGAADTSGFLAAVKLDGAAPTSVSTVSYSSLTETLGTMAEYSNVVAGTVTVNGQSIAVDPATTTLRDFITSLNDLSGVGATVNETSGAISIWSDSASTTLTVSDSSGLLSALGIASGTYGSSGVGRSRSNTTLTGTTTVTNAGDVASKVADALTGLNEVLGGIESDELTGVLEETLDRFRGNGVRGLGVTEEDGNSGLALDRDALMAALDALGENADLARALQSVLDEFETDIAAVAGWDAPASTVVQNLRLEETSRAQLMFDQSAASLLFARSSLQPHESEESTQKAAMKAYGETP